MISLYIITCFLCLCTDHTVFLNGRTTMVEKFPFILSLYTYPFSLNDNGSCFSYFSIITVTCYCISFYQCLDICFESQPGNQLCQDMARSPVTACPSNSNLQCQLNQLLKSPLVKELLSHIFSSWNWRSVIFIH